MTARDHPDGADSSNDSRARRFWTRTFIAGALLCLLGFAGCFTMWSLQDAADRRTRAECNADMWSARYHKGYPYEFVVITFVVFAVGVTVLVVTLLAKNSPRWIKIVVTCLLLPALLFTEVEGMEVSEYHDYPGSDESTSQGNPCGFG